MLWDASESLERYVKINVLFLPISGHKNNCLVKCTVLLGIFELKLNGLGSEDGVINLGEKH